MQLHHKDLTIEITNEPHYSINSADNTVCYEKEYCNEILVRERGRPVSKHGIRVWQSTTELSSAILCEDGGATGIHENAFLISDDNLLICCCNKVYSLHLPLLEINWVKKCDPATCFGIHQMDDCFIVHGELCITQIDRDGNEKWTFYARDIFVTQDGTEAFRMYADGIVLKDWEGYTYMLDKSGKQIYEL